ncbi:hypothetical protein LZ32DRAFT_305234 [Colletotrichum eremochloae]|nr:hypothetical protein LZ32DRAFT_305234 [Colletotrichum eremochloae]
MVGEECGTGKEKIFDIRQSVVRLPGTCFCWPSVRTCAEITSRYYAWGIVHLLQGGMLRCKRCIRPGMQTNCCNLSCCHPLTKKSARNPRVQVPLCKNASLWLMPRILPTAVLRQRFVTVGGGVGGRNDKRQQNQRLKAPRRWAPRQTGGKPEANEQETVSLCSQTNRVYEVARAARTREQACRNSLCGGGCQYYAYFHSLRANSDGSGGWASCACVDWKPGLA